MGFIFWILTICVCAIRVLAKTTFLQPPDSGIGGLYQDNPTYDEGQQITMQWQSDLPAMDIDVFQNYPKAGKDWQFNKTLLGNTKAKTLSWKVNLDGMIRDVPQGEKAILYFAVYLPGKLTNKEGGSHYFNVSVHNAASSSTASITTSTTASTTTPTADPTVTSPIDSTVPETSDSGSLGLSKAATAGVAVGSTVGGIIVLGGLGLLIKYMLRKRALYEAESNGPKAELPGHTIYEVENPTQPPLYHSNTPVYEAP